MKNTLLIIIGFFTIFSSIFPDPLELELKRREMFPDSIGIRIQKISILDDDNWILHSNEDGVTAALKTTNAGVDWDFIMDPFANEGTEKYEKTKFIEYISEDYIIAASKWKGIFISEDRGVTWDQYDLPRNTNLFWPTYFQVNSSGNGLLFDDINMKLAFVTRDFGKTWEEISYFYGTIHLDKEDILRSYAYDKIWTDTTIIVDGEEILDSIVSSYDMIIKKSEDMGKTWETIKHNVLPSDRVWNLLFLSDNEVIGIRSETRDTALNLKRPVIYKSYDGGKTWKEVFNDPTAKDTRAKYIVRDDTIYLGTSGGFFIYFSFMLSTDRGETWKHTPLNYVNDFDVTPSGKIVFTNTTYYEETGNYADLKENQKAQPHIKIYPNPSQDNLHISHPNMETITIYNIMGEQIKTYNLLTDELNISTQDLLTGTYFIEIETRDGEVLRQKFVRE